MIASFYARHIPAHGRVGRFVADEGNLAFVFPLLHDFPEADALVVGGTTRDAIIGRAHNGIHLMVSGVPKAKLDQYLRAKNASKAIDIRLPHNGISEHHTLPLVHDLARRDVTANAMAYSIRDGILHDPFNGLKDIDAGRIRSVSSRSDRFKGSPLHMMRVLRLATELGFTIEEGTRTALLKEARHLNRLFTDVNGKASFAIPRAHLGREFVKALKAHPAGAVRHMREQNLHAHIAPELLGLEALEDLTGRKAHDRLNEALELLHKLHASPTVSLALLISLFDEGAKNMLEALNNRLHLPLLTEDGFSFPTLKFLIENRNILEHIHPEELSAADFEHIFGDSRGEELLMFLRAYYVSMRKHSEARERLYVAEERKALLESLSHPNLVRGRDLLSLGLEPGHHLRQLMHKIRDAQLNGKVKTKTDALDYARELIVANAI